MFTFFYDDQLNHRVYANESNFLLVIGHWPAKVIPDFTLTLMCSPSHGYNFMTSCYL